MFYDLGGALGFLSTTLVSLYYPSLKAKYWHGANILLPRLPSFAPRQLLLSAALGIWTVRLGSFLAMVGEANIHYVCILMLILVQRALKAGGADSRASDNLYRC